MSDTDGACVVLIPSDTGLPVDVDGGAHITLAYFGEYNLDEAQEIELLRIAGKLMNSTDITDYNNIVLKSKTIQNLGEEGDAVTLTFDDSVESPAVLYRRALLEELSSELASIFRRAETYPEYIPHMTLGYISKGFDEDQHFDIPEYVHIKGIAVWNGENRTLIHNRNDTSIAQYGILRKSGRYPWGSGEDPYQRSKAFYDAYNQLKAEGLTDVQIATYFGEQSSPKDPDFNTRKLRDTRSQAKDEKRAGDRSMILRLKDKGLSNSAIARRMNMPEPTVRSLLKDSVDERVNITKVTAEKLRDRIGDSNYLDVGKGTENLMGVSPDRLKTAVAILKDEGYKEFKVNTNSLGVPGLTITTKVLAPPDTRFPEVMANQDKIVTIDTHTVDNGKTWTEPTLPKSLSSKRLQVVYDEDGGTQRDGLIELRPGVKDLDLGNNKYAQVRIAVDGTHYIKGMARYSDDLPDGVDVRFNSNKSKVDKPNKLDVLKELKRDPLTNEIDRQAPFGSMIKPGGQSGVLNMVNEEGDWDEWSKTFSSQMLSKQNESLAKRQLTLSHDAEVAKFKEISELTNPTVKNKLLETFADNVDAKAVSLKAMGLPRTNNKVIMPYPEIKENEVYAPTYKDGERVVLVRHPHGGIFEIPELTVNNRNPTAKKTLGAAKDAIGINPKVAEQLSGADFDGDSVLVIPQGSGPTKVQTKSRLEGLKNFDPQRDYPGYPGMKVMSNTQNEMGQISNLITDMTIGGANDADIAAAVRHSMVVIDAEKHKLNYKQSAIDNGIQRLRATYQPEGGASTIISRAKSEVRVPKFKPRPAGEGGPIDKETGAKVFVPTGETYEKTKVSVDVDGNKIYTPTGKIITKTTTVSKMANAKDATALVSTKRTPMEMIYADYANDMKSLANQARLEMLNTPEPKRSPTAAKAYAKQVDSLNAQLNLALQNAPLERQAQILGNAIVKAKVEANPGMDKDDIKKVKARAMTEARARTGASKRQVRVSPIEWEAIQAGAVSPTRLREILRHADLDVIREYATPRTTTGLSPALLARARSMLANGYPQSDVAEALGVSTSTLTRALK